MGLLTRPRAPERRRLALGGAALLATAAAVGAVLVLRGRDAVERGVPRRLYDGSAAARPPAGLADGNPAAVATRVRAVRLAGRDGRACVGLVRARVPATTPAVERTSVAGRTLTFREPGGDRVYACDGSAGAVEPRGPWCGGGAGLMRAGRLLDPRLDLVNCLDAHGRTVAFAWVEPRPRARWVGIAHDGFTELYEVAGGLPVRVATTGGIDHAASSVTLHVVEYSATGAPLGRSTLRAAVAG